MRRFIAILATSGLVVTVLPAVAQADVSITSFDLTPECVTPGSAVNATVSAKQNHWYHVHPVWNRVVVRQAQSGAVISQTDDGPRWVPFGEYRESRTEVIPANTPAGDYTVSVLLGSTTGASDWGSASRPLRVRQLAALCNL
jgi:hypothetical protein